MSMDGVPYVRVCLQGEGTGFPASLTGSRSYGARVLLANLEIGLFDKLA